MTAETTARFSIQLEKTTSRVKWLILLVAWAALALSTVCRLAWGTLAIPLGQSLSLPLAALGMFVTAFYVGYVLSNFVCGFVTDRVGGRIALSASLVGLAVATCSFSYAPTLIIGLVLQALMGLTAGADYAAAVKLVTTWFTEKTERGRAMGAAHERIVGRCHREQCHPAHAGGDLWLARKLPPPWRACRDSGGSLCHSSFVTGRNPGTRYRLKIPASTQRDRIASRARARKALMTRNFVLLALAGCGAFWGTLGFTSWAIPLMVKAHHISSVQAGYVLALAGIAGLFSKPTIGWLSDYFGARRKMLAIISLVFFCAMLLGFGQLDDLTAFRLAAPFLGIGAFVYSPLLVTMAAEQAGASKAGSAAGVTNALWQLGSALSPALIGLVFQARHSFALAFAVLAIGPLLGAICLAFIKESQTQ
ncbi:MFS transporter [Cupriavidus basilensis]